MTEVDRIRSTVHEIMSDGNARTSRWILDALRSRGIESNICAVARACRDDPTIIPVGMRSHRTEYRMKVRE